MKFVKKLFDALKKSYTEFSKERDRLMLSSKNSPLVQSGDPIAEFLGLIVCSGFQVVFAIWFFACIWKIAGIVINFPFN